MELKDLETAVREAKEAGEEARMLICWRGHYIGFGYEKATAWCPTCGTVAAVQDLEGAIT